MSADYETPVLSLIAPDGRELRIVEHYTDRIMFGDPVKLMVYDADGKVVAETPYYRGVIAQQLSPNSMRVFGIAFGSDFSNQVWIFSGTQFDEQFSLLGRFAATAASVRKHWLGYLITIGFGWYGADVYMRQFQPDDPWSLVPGFWAWCGVLALFSALFHSSLSFLVVLGSTLLLVLPLADSLVEVLLVLCLYGFWVGLWLCGSIMEASAQLLGRRPKRWGETAS